jgi:hypothetical protein
LQENQDHHQESIFGYIKDTKHQVFSDFSLAFPKALLAKKQRGPLDPGIAHEVMDHLICNFVSKYIKFPMKHEPLSLDIKDYVVFEQEAMDHLYAQLPKL